MDRRQRLVIALLLAMPAIVSARYVSPSPPPGFTAMPGGGWGFKPPTPTEQLGSIMRGPGPSLSGAAETRAAYKLGAGAARALAKAVIGGGVLGAAIYGAEWLAEHCFKKEGGSYVRTCGASDAEVSTGHTYAVIGYNTGGPFKSEQAACDAFIANRNRVQGPDYTWASAGIGGSVVPYNRYCSYVRTALQGGATDAGEVTLGRDESACPAGWYITSAGCVQTPPPATATPQQVEDEMATKPLPQTLPPGIVYPLDPTVPFIFNPDLANPPHAQPLRVPQGNPVPVPNTEPQKWVQPVTRYVPAPTSTDPTRLDAQPESVPTDQTGLTGPESVTSESPEGTPKEDTPDLCEKNPDILACAKWKLGELDALPVPNESKTLAINKESGFGPANGQCPAPKVVNVLGTSLSFSMGMLCDFATMIRPLLIGFAYLSAALAFIGIGRKD